MVMNDSLPAVLGRRRTLRHRSMAGRTAFVARVVVVARKQRETGVGRASALDIGRRRERRGVDHAGDSLLGREHEQVSQPAAAEPLPSVTRLWVFIA
jgi:hypothetical protein